MRGVHSTTINILYLHHQKQDLYEPSCSIITAGGESRCCCEVISAHNLWTDARFKCRILPENLVLNSYTDFEETWVAIREFVKTFYILNVFELSFYFKAWDNLHSFFQTQKMKHIFLKPSHATNLHCLHSCHSGYNLQKWTVSACSHKQERFPVTLNSTNLTLIFDHVLLLYPVCVYLMFYVKHWLVKICYTNIFTLLCLYYTVCCCSLGDCRVKTG